MFRLAHISDIHLAPLPALRYRELLSKRITGYLNWQRKRAGEHRPDVLANLVSHLLESHPDHVAVTGDLVNLALPAEIDAATSFLESLGGGHDVTVVCGNHDAYVPGALNMAIGKWQSWLRGDDDLQILSDEDFPVLRIRENIAIIGCNSARATLPFQATGFFENAQAARLARILRDQEAEGKCRVVLIHHPPFPNATRHHKRLIGDARFRSVIAEQGAELILHGHTHLDTIEWIEGKQGSVPVVCVPAAGQMPGGNRPPGRYNLFEISGKQVCWKIRLQQFGYHNHPHHDGETLKIGLLGEHDLKG